MIEEPYVSSIVGGTFDRSSWQGLGRPVVVATTSSELVVVDELLDSLALLRPDGRCDPCGAGDDVAIRNTGVRILKETPIVGRAGNSIVLVGASGKVSAVWFPEMFPAPSYAVASVAALATGDTVVGFVDLTERLGGALVRFGSTGECCWCWCPGPEKLLDPAAIAVTAQGDLVVVDPQLHVVTLLSQDGSIKRCLGQHGIPGSQAGLFRAPTGVAAHGDGFVVADSMNNRLLAFGSSGSSSEILPPPPEYSSWSPLSVARVDKGALLLVDASRDKVLLLRNGRLKRQWQGRRKLRGSFACPRSVEIHPDGTWLVADTNHHRVVKVDPNSGAIQPLFGDGVPGRGSQLHWPRSAKSMNEEVVIADGMNGRIIWLRDRTIVNEVRKLRAIDDSLDINFSDPHDVSWLSDTRILVTDAKAGIVAEIDRSGKAYWIYGHRGQGQLHDPHQAHRQKDGTTWIVDSLNNRLISISADCMEEKSIDHIIGPLGQRISLSYPRVMERWGEGWVIVDGEGVVSVVNRHWRIKSRIGPILEGSEGPIFLGSAPRSVAAMPTVSDALVMSDYTSGRLVVVSGLPDREAAS